MAKTEGARGGHQTTINSATVIRWKGELEFNLGCLQARLRMGQPFPNFEKTHMGYPQCREMLG